MENELREQTIFFNDSVVEYQLKQKEVMKNFVFGCIELGEILVKTKLSLKEEGAMSWTAYLQEIGLHITMANQQMRLFEYSKAKVEKDVLGSVITNWEKLNLFLALPEEQREKLLQKDLDATTTSADFREAVAELKNIDLPVELEESFSDQDVRKKIEENVGGNPLLVDTKKASKRVQEDLKMSIIAREVLEGVLLIEKTKEILRNKVELPAEEKEQLKMLYAKQLIELQEELDNFFS